MVSMPVQHAVLAAAAVCAGAQALRVTELLHEGSFLLHQHLQLSLAEHGLAVNETIWVYQGPGDLQDLHALCQPLQQALLQEEGLVGGGQAVVLLQLTGQGLQLLPGRDALAAQFLFPHGSLSLQDRLLRDCAA